MFKRLLPFIAALILLGLNQVFFFYPSFFFSALALGALVIVFGTRYLARQKAFAYWPIFLIAPLLFFFSASLYASLLAGRFWVQLIFLLDAVFAAAYLNNLYYYFSEPNLARQEKLERLTLSGAWLTTFALGASLFGLPVFLDWPFSVLLALFCLAVLLSWLPFLFFASAKVKSAAPVFIISLAIVALLGEALSLLPLNFNILGFMAAIFAYFLLTINRLHWSQRLNRQSLKWPLIFSLILIIISLLTARWL